jgi:tetratricopeptide (TPR) repeat protein
MRLTLFVFTPVLFTGMLFVFFNTDIGPQAKGRDYITETDPMGCAPADPMRIAADDNGKFIRLLPGWGKHSYRITTGSDSSQIYFNQGLSMYYSYHAREAIASFKEAARFDSASAMTYWGLALAMGPSYNFGYRYKMNSQVPAVIAKMVQYSVNANEKERDLIAAMQLRYKTSDTTDRERATLNIAYADAMKPLVSKYPDDLDIKALYTDAVMLLHSWDFWYNNGDPKPWTTELVEHCEDILQKDPHHPAALHYYIHVTEASRNPGVALASADSLLRLFPGVAHMVHMSSHEYERLGHYAKGVKANEAADSSLGLYAGLAAQLSIPQHLTHYQAVEAYCALSGAMGTKGLEKAITVSKTVLPANDKTYEQGIYMFPALARVRMGRWNDILEDTMTVKSEWSYAIVLKEFSRGMAYAATGKYASAKRSVAKIREALNDTILRITFAPHTSSPYECSKVAENILVANIAFRQNRYDAAINAIRAAVRAEDSLIYSEPKLWMLPARQYLGYFLLKMNKAPHAEKVYREDLSWNPGNGWSLLGLYQALRAQRKNKELKALKEDYERSFSEADELPKASVY